MARFRIGDDQPRKLPAMQRVIVLDPIGDPQAWYNELKELGKLPVDKLFDRYELQDRLNDAAANYHRARQLQLHLAREAERYERSVRPEIADVRRRALKRLTDWVRVEDASRRKTVTDEMVMDQVFASEDLAMRYNAVAEKLAEMKQVVGVAESLVDAWRNRMFLLQGMSNALPKVAKE